MSWIIRAAFTLLAACLVSPLHAQATNAVVVATCGTPPAAYTAGANRQLTQDTTGTLCAGASGGGGGASASNITQVNSQAVNTGTGAAGTGTLRVTTSTDSTVQAVGNIAAGAADSGNPVKIGGVVSSSFQTGLTNGNRANLLLSKTGMLAVTSLFSNAVADGVPNGGVSYSLSDAGTIAFPVTANYVFNGSTWDRYRTIQGSDGTGLGITAVAVAPSSNANNAASTQQCTVACASTIVSGAHNLYGLNFSSTATGWLLLEDATSCAANGTVTPIRAYAYPTANVTTTVSWSNIPKAFATGLAACFSTTGPYTATASTTAFISLDYK